MAGRHAVKNADGTVNMAGLSGHVADIKAKYAQNAKNYEANTGHPFNSTSPSSSSSTEEVSKDVSAQGSGQVGQARGDAEHDGPEGFADRGQPQETSGKEQGQGQAQQQGGAAVVPEGHGSHV